MARSKKKKSRVYHYIAFINIGKLCNGQQSPGAADTGGKESIPLNASHIISKKISERSRLVVVLNVNKHPLKLLIMDPVKSLAFETLKDAGKTFKIQWLNDSFIEIPISKN